MARSVLTPEEWAHWKQHGSADKATFTEVGYNSRLDALQAAVLRVLLPELGAWAAARRSVAAAYERLGLAEHARIPRPLDGAVHGYHLYVVRHPEPERLAAYEVRTSAIHFQIKRLLGEPKDREKAVKACSRCPALVAAMTADVVRGQQIARARLKKNPRDQEALFFLGKINLNHVWLQLSTLGRRTGWSEYREARRAIEDVLAMSPRHVRARVARAGPGLRRSHPRVVAHHARRRSRKACIARCGSPVA